MFDEREERDEGRDPGDLQHELDEMISLAKEKATRWDVIYERAATAGEEVARQGASFESSEYPPSFVAQQHYVWFLLQIAARLGRDIARMDDRLTRLERKMRTLNSRRI